MSQWNPLTCFESGYECSHTITHCINRMSILKWYMCGFGRKTELSLTENYAGSCDKVSHLKGFGGSMFCYFDLEIVWRWEPLKHIALIKCSIWESQMSQNIWNTRNIHHCLKGPCKALIAWSNNSASKIVNEKKIW